jgi:hypothetical protein
MIMFKQIGTFPTIPVSVTFIQTTITSRTVTKFTSSNNETNFVDATSDKFQCGTCLFLESCAIGGHTGGVALWQ